MRIAVIGAGGVGGSFGAALAKAGNDVMFVARGAHLAAMRARGHRPAPFTTEHERAFGIAAQLPQRPELIPLNWMHASDPAFEPADVQMGASEIDLRPLEINRLADPQGRDRQSCGVPRLGIDRTGDRPLPSSRHHRGGLRTRRNIWRRPSHRPIHHRQCQHISSNS
jgi:glycine/D-amino acid oxidase-like deaminating enzyme